MSRACARVRLGACACACVCLCVCVSGPALPTPRNGLFYRWQLLSVSSVSVSLGGGSYVFGDCGSRYPSIFNF